MTTSYFTKARMMQWLRQTGAYLFLLAIYVFILFEYSFDAWIGIREIGYIYVLPKTLTFLFLYALANHIWIKKVVGLKAVLLFETILLSTLLAVTSCYLIV